MNKVIVRNKTRQVDRPIQAKYCDTLFSRFRGLMFYRKLGRGEGLMLVYGRDSKVDTGIHMFFMNFDIAVFWINSRMEIVDKKIARKWRSILTPSKPAQYVLETLPLHYDDFEVGDKLEFEFKS